jgi:hypothetical protein
MNQRDLALAYSPGVARANLMAVIASGTTVLGLGNLISLLKTPPHLDIVSINVRTPHDLARKIQLNVQATMQ